jgi:LuxR family maltose regulon positive regulatory protein
MSTTILATKLYIPPPRPNVVLRTRLSETLNEGLQRKLTLISAPAGFGKTTLVSAWVRGNGLPAAWLSLDEGDHEPTRFLTYLVAALQTIAAGVGEDVLGALQSSQPPPAEVILTDLLNEISALPDHIVLVLDDYHVIDANSVDVALTYLVERLPPQMHVIVATRADPHLPLARLRARDQLTELRAADLRFTPSEAATFLNHVMGLSLSAADIAQLSDRTEGWIAGLQLAALSLQGHQDVRGFVRAFAGDRRYIADYLVEEVLQRQPEPVRRFLLQTAILDRLSGPLCDAITGQEEGAARLESLERGNFFVVPLDDNRHWYRYHHLFGDMLRARLLVEQPDQVTTLHRRASAWFEQHGWTADAIRHALAVGDLERAANLIELAGPEIHRVKQEAALLDWLNMLPDELVRRRPVLSVTYALALLSAGELEAVDVRLRDAERWLDAPAETADTSHRAPDSLVEMVVVNQEEFRRLPASIAVYRAALAQALGDGAATVQYAQQALSLFSEDDRLGRGAATALLGLATWTSGNLETAYRTFADGIASVQRAGNLADAISGAIALAEIRIAQGRLHEAMRIYERALRLATELGGEQGRPALQGTADLHVGMSGLHREHNDLSTATRHLLRSRELGEHNSVPQNRYRWYVAMARIQQAQGDLNGAIDLLHEAERLYVGDFFPTVRPVAALVTRAWVTMGRVSDALRWVHEQGLSVTDNLTYLREFEHITLVRVLLAEYEKDQAAPLMREAMGLLERLLQAAEAGERTGSVIEILALQALAHRALGDMPGAIAPLERALTLAEPEGYIRIFVDEGPLMERLLRAAVTRGIMSDYAGRLLQAFGAEHHERHASQRSAGEASTSAAGHAAQALAAPLTQRELDVLRLFRTELSGPEIATELVVALSTVRTHTKSIYSKLNVTNRRAAVKRASELNLLWAPQDHAQAGIHLADKPDTP